MTGDGISEKGGAFLEKASMGTLRSRLAFPNRTDWGFIRSLYFGLVTLGLIVVLLVGLAIDTTTRSRDDLRKVYEAEALPMAELQAMVGTVRETAFRLAGYLADQFPGPGTKGKLQELYDDAVASWKRYRQMVPDSALMGTDLDLIHQAESYLNSGFKQYIEKLRTNVDKEDKKALSYSLEDEWPEVQVGLLKPVGKLLASSQEHVRLAYTSAQKRSRVANILAVVVSVFAGTALLYSFFSLRLASQKVKETILVLGKSADAVDKETERLRATSQSLAESTSEQAAAMQETAASISEMSSMISKSAENAGESEHAADSTRSVASKGKDKSAQMLASIREISNAQSQIIEHMVESNQKVGEITAVIAEIGNKTSVINDIVFQTKLLSFNASVEAARAGEHGKGFAVVAEEVGNLAQMSGNAAKEISQMLQESIKRVEEVIQIAQSKVSGLVETGKTRITYGTTLAEENNRLLDEIMVQITLVKNMADQITAATREESAGVTEISKAMGQLDQISHRNSNETQQVARSAVLLKKEFHMLRQAMQDLTKVVWGSKA